MDVNKRKCNDPIELNDLIGDAVKNAVARRNLAIDSEDDLLALSDEELASVTGGKIAGSAQPTGKQDIAIAGFKPIEPPPATVGLIAVNDNIA